MSQVPRAGKSGVFYTILLKKFIALRAFIRWPERFHIRTLTAHLKVLQPKEANSLKRSRLQEITKLRDEKNIYKLKAKRIILKIS